MKLLCIVAAALASVSGYAKTYQVHGTATFHAQGHPGIVNVDGTGGTVTGTAEAGDDGKVSGTFVVALKDLTTDMAARDAHMHGKYLEDAKYPEARLVLAPWPRSAAASPFAGSFSLHGKTHDVAGTASVTTEGKIHAEFDVDVSDYGIEAPSMVLVKVEPVVHVTVEADAK